MELIEERLELGGRPIALLRPPDPEALLDEEAFEREEFLPYWAELWPSGLVLARELVRRDVAGLSVVELGCGLGVPSLAAALGGARVLATDWAPDAVALLQENAKRNGIALAVVRMDWAAPEALLDRPWDLVLAADVLYERRNVGPLLTLLERLDASEVLVAEPGRPAAQEFLARARERWRLVSARPDGGSVELHRLRAR